MLRGANGCSTERKGILVAMFWVHVLNTFVLVVGIFLIALILIQKGKGGGLAGAFGGAGGSSPFGSRAGDTFTRVTLVTALIWAVAIIFEVMMVQSVGASKAAGIFQ
jgi:preprotein translocase subunit SecG